ncbi:hypothetical protein C8R44DRAFT_889078 [Mycena epipterygia]|nr:hypothetical protein C8R44DRAFT_889078 [Mycena epipterygia]
MFKSAATKIAHNSTLPALSGNKDLRPLQDLITAEKAVLISLQKLSVDFSKASEALRVWGAGEGDDLGDILGASTTILAHFSAALSGYAAREHSIRDVSMLNRLSFIDILSICLPSPGPFFMLSRKVGEPPGRHIHVDAVRRPPCLSASRRAMTRIATPSAVWAENISPRPGTLARRSSDPSSWWFQMPRGAVGGVSGAAAVVCRCRVLSSGCPLWPILIPISRPVICSLSDSRPPPQLLKSIRTREEALDELKRRRKTALGRADSAEKKLNKMGPEHKNLAAQTDALNTLQAQIRGMDGEIMNEEAALGDFKRSSARTLMGLKFGGLMEACEKGCIVAEVGRGVVSEISEEPTPPGLARAMYLGHQRTEQRVAEAERAVAEIVFAPLPPASNAPPRLNTSFSGEEGGTMGDGMGMLNSGLSVQNTGISMQNTGISMQNTGASSLNYGGPPYDPTGSGFLPPPDVGGVGLMDGASQSQYAPPAGSPGGTYSSFNSSVPGGTYASSASTGYAPATPGGMYSASQGGAYPASQGGSYGASQGGSYAAPGGTYAAPGGSYPAPGGTYAAPGGSYPAPGGSYPAPSQGGTTPGGTTAGGTDAEARDEPSVGLSSTGVGIGGGPEGPAGGRFATFPVRGRGYSLRDDSASQPPGAPPSLGAAARKDTNGSDFMAAVLDAGEFGTRSAQGGSASQFSQPQSQPGSQFSTKQQERDRERQRQQEEEPAPEYRDYEPTSHSQVYDYSVGGVPPGPPPGAAAPVVGGVWVGDNGNGSRNPSGLAVEEGGGDRQSTVSEDIGLAYMNMGGEQEEGEREREARLSKHVRFGEDSTFVEPEPPYVKREQSQSSSSSASRSRRVPPPTMDPAEDERALNAAAAREVSRELDALNFSPPAPPPPQVQVQDEAGWEFAAPTTISPTREPAPSRDYGAAHSPNREYGSPPKGRDSPQNQYSQPAPPSRDYTVSPPQNQYAPPSAPPPNREPSPMLPPAAPFARKATLDTAPLPPGAGMAHQRTPSWDPPAQPAPSVPTHHSTPSWALTPAPPADGPGSPSSPRLDAPYRAPVASRSTSSLNSQVPPGARTISAAAFRRPQKTTDPADTSPLSLKKRLPASPYPQQRAASGLRETTPQPQEDDSSFDYISAYSNGGRDSQAFQDDGSPMQADYDYGRLGKVGVVGGAPTSPGYSAGRFATDLDPDGVR